MSLTINLCNAGQLIAVSISCLCPYPLVPLLSVLLLSHLVSYFSLLESLVEVRQLERHLGRPTTSRPKW